MQARDHRDTDSADAPADLPLSILEGLDALRCLPSVGARGGAVLLIAEGADGMLDDVRLLVAAPGTEIAPYGENTDLDQWRLQYELAPGRHATQVVTEAELESALPAEGREWLAEQRRGEVIEGPWGRPSDATIRLEAGQMAANDAPPLLIGEEYPLPVRVSLADGRGANALVDVLLKRSLMIVTPLAGRIELEGRELTEERVIDLPRTDAPKGAAVTDLLRRWTYIRPS